MEAIILAGGFGTRLATVISDVPKPMAPVADKPFLQYIIDDLINQGVTRIVIAVCHKKECIIEYFKNQYRGVEIIYSIENQPLKTGGAIKQALEYCSEKRVFVINGDTYFDIDLNEMKRFSESNDSNVMIAIKKMCDVSRYGQVILKGNNIEQFCEKKYCEEGYINGGTYLLNRKILKNFPMIFSLEDDFFTSILSQDKIWAYKSEGFFIDIGIPEDYLVAQKYFRGK